MATGDSPPPAAGRRSLALGGGGPALRHLASPRSGPGRGVTPLPGLLSAGAVSGHRCGGPLVTPAGRAAFQVQGLGCPSPGSVPADRALSLPRLPEARVFPF